jgi:ribosome biogenesis GTPase
LIDSPGLQEFGLGHLDRQEIEYAFREFRPYLGQCRFRDCRHDREPDCALVAAVEAGQIDARRFALYHRIVG